MGALAGLGALASGVGQGLERGQMMTARQQSIDAEAKRAKDQEAEQQDIKAANDAMLERLRGFEDEHKQSQPSAMKNYLTLGGTDGSMPDQTGNDAPVQPAAPFKPSQQQILAAAQARTDKLFELGRHDVAVKQWAQDEGLRAQMRKQAVEKGMLAYKSNGDVKPLLTGVYETLDDGYDLGGVEPINNPDPKAPAAWNIERVNTRTGEKKVSKVTADQVEGLVQFAMDPAKAAQYSLMEKLAGFRGDQQRQTNIQRGEMTLDQIDRRNEGAADVAEIRGGATRDAARIRVDGTITAAKIRAGAAAGKSGGSNGVQSRTELSDGRIALTMKDGSTRIAVDDEGNPLTSLSYEKLVGNTARTVSKSLDGLTATPEANQDRARNMLPKAKTAAPKRLTYDPQTGTFK